MHYLGVLPGLPSSSESFNLFVLIRLHVVLSHLFKNNFFNNFLEDIMKFVNMLNLFPLNKQKL